MDHSVSLKDSNPYAVKLPRRVVKVTGPEAELFVQGLVTQNVLNLAQDLRYGFFLNTQGRYLFDCFIFYLKEALCLDVPAKDAEALVLHLSKYVLTRAITLSLSYDEEIVAMWPHGAWLPKTLIQQGALAVWQDPRWIGMGWRCVWPLGQTYEGNFQDLQAYESWQGCQGIPDSSCFVPGKTIPLFYGIDQLNGISWTKGCYMGQELMARTRYQGHIRRHLFCITGVEPQLRDIIEQQGELCWHQGDKALALLNSETVTVLTDLEGVYVTNPPWRVS